MILNVDGFLSLQWTQLLPFDPNVLYEMKVDQHRDGVEDLTFQFRFKTEIRQPGVFTGYVGGIAEFRPSLRCPLGVGRTQPPANLFGDDGQERRLHQP